ncbi:YbjQ family protein [Haloplanus sp. C73]|uniref:YbjQ family protein n=1 Tax=Haloplanus sp. C73 TaxID=3421641 RepID=UPI003EBC1747
MSRRRRPTISTRESIAGEEIQSEIGVVMGNTVRARNVGQDMKASLQNIRGGELDGYSELLTDARNEALDRMEETAMEADADAIVNLDFQITEVTDGVTEVLAYGTAVSLE